MGRKKYLLLCSVLLGLSACQNDEPGAGNETDRRIYLSAKVENTTVQSRTPYLLHEPDAANPLEVDVWASTVSGSFPDQDKDGTGTDNVVALHTTAKFTAGKEQLLDKAVYPNDGNTEVYFVGFHPKGAWSGSETSVSCNFTGKEDVMFAPQVSGKYADKAWPTFIFRHLLTWLRIEMVADSEAVRDAWGKVKKLTVKSPQQVTVDLSKQYSSSDVSFTSEVPLQFYKTDTDVPFADYTLKGPQYATDDDATLKFAEEVAYVLCAPVTADEANKEYILTIETENRTVDVAVDLNKADNTTPFKGHTMNYQFTILLRFKLGSNILVTAKATDWVNGGLGNGDFEEDDAYN